MSDLLPLAAYNLNIEPYTPTPAIDVTTPVTVRITMAAIDPEALDDEANPSTLRIIKRNPDFDDEDDADALLGDYDEDELDVSEEEEEEEEEEEKPKDKKSKSKSKSKSKKEESEDELDDESDEDDEEGDEDDEFLEFVLATLSPKTQYQQSLDLVIAPEEEVQFIVTGSYRVSLTGNFVKHPFDTPDYDDEDSEEGEESYDEDEDDYLTPDEDADLEELEEASDIEAKIQELVEKEQSKSKKNNKKKQPEPEEEEEEEEQEAPASVEETKKAKKAKKEKKVEFKKDLEEGPTPAKKEEKKEKKEKPKTKVLEGGIIVEDRVVGTGKACKKGSKVGMRYIGKLKNGKVFDKNTSGKPFVFNLGRGEVIKGWDIGVAGMAVGGERRIVIPAPYAYGKQALPGIPANSELTFDVKLVSLK